MKTLESINELVTKIQEEEEIFIDTLCRIGFLVPGYLYGLTKWLTERTTVFYTKLPYEGLMANCVDSLYMKTTFHFVWLKIETLFCHKSESWYLCAEALRLVFGSSNELLADILIC